LTSFLGDAIGPQRPRVRSVPHYAKTRGPDAVDAAAIAGLILDPWQRFALDDILAIRADGLPATTTAALIVPRQNGKGSVIEAYVLEGLFLAGLRLITYTAHETKTADEMFDRMRELIEGTEVFAKRLAPNGVRLANGQQQIKLKSGARLRVIARTKSSGRGFTGDRIILDEAQDLQQAHMRSMVPTLATRPEAHVLMAGSAPDPEAEVLPEIMDAGRDGTDPDLSYLEWSVPDPAKGEAVNLLDPELVRQANPGYGLRLFDRAVDRERRLLDDEGFARERLGIRGGGGFAGVISASVWERLKDMTSSANGPVAFAVDVNPEQSRASIAAAGVRADDRWHGEVVDARDGTDWIAERLAELVEAHESSAVLLDPATPAGALLGDLEDLEIDVTEINTREYGQACAGFLDAVNGDMLRHRSQPLLNTAIDAGRKRTLGDAGWGWQRKSPTADITPLVALTLALHGLRNTPSTPPQSRRLVTFA
jgi:hypothetical protein